MIREVSRHFGDAVYNTVIPRNIRLGEAPSFGKPVTQYDSQSAGAMAYRRFAEEFLDRQGMSYTRQDASRKMSARIPIFLTRTISQNAS